MFAVLVLACVVLYLIPLDTYIPKIEKTLEQQLQETVSIQKLQLIPLPLPHVSVRGIQIGKKPGISIQTINVHLVISELLSGHIALRISLHCAAATTRQVQKVLATLTGAPAGPSDISVRELRLSGIHLALPKFTLGPVEAQIDFDTNTKPQRIWFAMDDRKISATILPLPEQRYSVLVEAHDWNVPQLTKMRLGNLKLQGQIFNSATSSEKNNFQFSGDANISRMEFVTANTMRPLLIDAISSHVVFRNEQLDLSRIQTRLYGGKLTGSARLNFNRLQLSTDISASNLSMQPLVQSFNKEVLFSGDMDGTAQLAMPLNASRQFMNGLQMQSQFNLRNGAISKVDLIEATKITGAGSTKEASTQFDSLTGLLNIDAGGYHFRELKLASGVLSASGKIDVDPALQLNGALDTHVKNTIGLVSMPMAISGTVSDPVVRPTKSAMAGAAVGTAILGPGLGTAAGIKVGGFLNKLFGGDDEKNSPPDDKSQTPVKK